jgi:sterol desaturase/sphingolipid hydroxylase (fatty acid hydroxylase superfamily)
LQNVGIGLTGNSSCLRENLEQGSAVVDLQSFAQWLNDNDIALTAGLVGVALLLELSRLRAAEFSAAAWLGSWRTNAFLFACGTGMSLALAPWLSPIFSAALSGDRGLLSMLDVSFGWKLLLGFLLLDLFAYVQHRLMHALPVLWRLHQVHHSDPSMTASTHFRQHPLALLLGAALSLGLVFLMGIHGVAWILHGLAALALPLWQHAALKPAPLLDRWLGWLLVTPTQHRTHHRPDRMLHDSNYGAVLSIWDRVFGSLIVETATADAPQFGVREWTGEAAQNFWSVLAMPFKTGRVPAPTLPTVVRAKVAKAARSTNSAKQKS